MERFNKFIPEDQDKLRISYAIPAAPKPHDIVDGSGMMRSYFLRAEPTILSYASRWISERAQFDLNRGTIFNGFGVADDPLTMQHVKDVLKLTMRNQGPTT